MSTLIEYRLTDYSGPDYETRRRGVVRDLGAVMVDEWLDSIKGDDERVYELQRAADADEYPWQLWVDGEGPEPVDVVILKMDIATQGQPFVDRVRQIQRGGDGLGYTTQEHQLHVITAPQPRLGSPRA